MAQTEKTHTNNRPGPLPPSPPGAAPVTLPDRDWSHMTLNWTQYRDNWKLSDDGTYYALRFVYYATKLLSKEHQYMNLYVPAAYLHSDGSVNWEGRCGRYTARTAPIVMYNNCGGWMSSVPGGVNRNYIAEGFVHVNVGARSRDLGSVGKAPSACVDQKAAVRMLRLHDQWIPGCKERIISCGGSGGGQMSSILGATGDMEAYFPYLAEIGAAGISENDGQYVSTISDRIFASQCFCPIADIEHADMAYAWQRYDDPNISVSGFGIVGEQKLTPFQQVLQEDLAQAWAEYINGLELKNQQDQPLTFPQLADGSYALRRGNYYEQILSNISDALNAYLDYHTQPDGSVDVTVVHGFDSKEELHFQSAADYIASLKGSDQWLTRKNGRYQITSLSGFCDGTGLKRGKDCPGFDTFCCTAENNAFGGSTEPSVHFSASNGRVLQKFYTRYNTLDGFDEADVDNYIAQSQRQELQRQTYLMNATAILLATARGKEHAIPAEHWRTRNGTADEHTSFCIAYDLCMAAQMAGSDVDYALIWNAGHGDVDGDGTGTFEEWVHHICKEGA